MTSLQKLHLRVYPRVEPPFLLHKSTTTTSAVETHRRLVESLQHRERISASGSYDEEKKNQASLDEIRKAAARLCREYLTGRWKDVTEQEIIVRRISGGLSNFLYYVSLPAPKELYGPDLGPDDGVDAAKNTRKPQTSEWIATPGDGNANNNRRERHDSAASSSGKLAATMAEPQEVLLRVYGQGHGEDALEGMITESVVFALLSERNFGPKLHGIFPGGRLEQYIPARALLTVELSDPRISRKIGEKMGEIHSLNIPMSKEPDWLWNCMERWLKIVNSILNRTECKQKSEQIQIVKNFDFYEETKWLKSLIEKANYPVLFCHNDLQEGNILFREVSNECDNDDEASKSKRSRSSNNNELYEEAELSNPSSEADADPELMIIDFEYCAYNYRGFDLANHFLEWTYDYSNPEFPFYYHKKQQYPKPQQRRIFIEAYLKKLNEGVEDYTPTDEEIEGVEQEVRLFSMFSHLFWTLWSVVNVNSNIEFGYWEYAVTRTQEYKEIKKTFINTP